MMDSIPSSKNYDMLEQNEFLNLNGSQGAESNQKGRADKDKFEDFENRRTIGAKSNSRNQKPKIRDSGGENGFFSENKKSDDSEFSEKDANLKLNPKAKTTARGTQLTEKQIHKPMTAGNAFEFNVDQSAKSCRTVIGKPSDQRLSHNLFTERNTFNPKAGNAFESRQQQSNANILAAKSGNKDFVSNFLNLEIDQMKETKKHSIAAKGQVHDTYFVQEMGHRHEDVLKHRTLSLDIDCFKKEDQRRREDLEPEAPGNSKLQSSFFSSASRIIVPRAKRNTQDYDDKLDLKKKVDLLTAFEKSRVQAKKKRKKIKKFSQRNVPAKTRKPRSLKRKINFNERLYTKEDIIEAYDQLLKKKDTERSKSKRMKRHVSGKKGRRRQPKRATEKPPEKTRKHIPPRKARHAKTKLARKSKNIEIKSIHLFASEMTPSGHHFLKKPEKKRHDQLKPPKQSLKNLHELEECRRKKDFALEKIIVPELGLDSISLKPMSELKNMNQNLAVKHFKDVRFDNLIFKVEPDEKNQISECHLNRHFSAAAIDQIMSLGFNLERAASGLSGGFRLRQSNKTKQINFFQNLGSLSTRDKERIWKKKKDPREETTNLKSMTISINLDEESPVRKVTTNKLKQKMLFDLENKPNKNRNRVARRKRKKLGGTKSNTYEMEASKEKLTFMQTSDIHSFHNVQRVWDTAPQEPRTQINLNVLDLSTKTVMKKLKKGKKMSQNKNLKKTIYLIPKNEFNQTVTKKATGVPARANRSLRKAKAKRISNAIDHVNDVSRVQPSSEYNIEDEPDGSREKSFVSKKDEFMYRLNKIKPRKIKNRASLIESEQSSFRDMSKKAKNRSRVKAIKRRHPVEARRKELSADLRMQSLNLKSFFQNKNPERKKHTIKVKNEAGKLDSNSLNKPNTDASFAKKFDFPPFKVDKKTPAKRGKSKINIVSTNRSKSQVILKNIKKKLKRRSNRTELFGLNSSKFSIQSIFKNKMLKSKNQVKRSQDKKRKTTQLSKPQKVKTKLNSKKLKVFKSLHNPTSFNNLSFMNKK